jgi:ribosomal protein S18
LTPVQNDSNQYGQRKLQFDQIADPRIFQEMTSQDVAKLKASMSAAEQAELTRKIRLARQMGIIR